MTHLRMLLSAAVLVAALATPAPLSPAPAPSVVLIRAGREVSLDPGLAQAITTDVLALFASTTFDSSAVASAQSWAGFARGTYLVVKLGEATRITVLRTRAVLASELLVSLSRESEPTHLLARHAGRYWAFAKYDPRVLARLVCRPELRLRVYAAFCRRTAP